MLTVPRKIRIRIPGGSLAALAYGDPASPYKAIGLHGWMDNAATHTDLAPVWVSKGYHFVSVDFAGHGRSPHKSADASYLSIEYAASILSALGSLGWARELAAAGGGGGGGGGVEWDEDSADVAGSGEHACNESHTNGAVSVALCGHSMGAGVSTMLLGSAPDVFDAAFLVEALGLPSRDAAGSTAYLRGGVQSQHGLLGKRPKPYVNVTHAVAARSATAASWPGEQFLTYDAALPMVLRSCVAAGEAEGVGDGAQYKRVGGAAAAAAGEHLRDDVAPVRFGHDLRIMESSKMYFSEEQMRAYIAGIACPTCVVWAEKGWPYAASAAAGRTRVLVEALRAAQAAHGEEGGVARSVQAPTAGAMQRRVADVLAACQSSAAADADVFDAIEGSAARETADAVSTAESSGAPPVAPAPARALACDVAAVVVRQEGTAAAHTTEGGAAPAEAGGGEGGVRLHVATRRSADASAGVEYPAAASGERVSDVLRAATAAGGDEHAQSPPSWLWNVTVEGSGHHPHLEAGSKGAVCGVLGDFLETCALPVGAERLRARREAGVGDARM